MPPGAGIQGAGAPDSASSFPQEASCTTSPPGFPKCQSFSGSGQRRAPLTTGLGTSAAADLPQPSPQLREPFEPQRCLLSGVFLLRLPHLSLHSHTPALPLLLASQKRIGCSFMVTAPVRSVRAQGPLPPERERGSDVFSVLTTGNTILLQVQVNQIDLSKRGRRQVSWRRILRSHESQSEGPHALADHEPHARTHSWSFPGRSHTADCLDRTTAPASGMRQILRSLYCLLLASDKSTNPSRKTTCGRSGPGRRWRLWTPRAAASSRLGSC